MTTQCKACPWRVAVEPARDIPGGYSEEKHCALANTIAEPGNFRPGGAMMACHETPPGKERACAGWLHNQLGVGNNFALRMRHMAGHFGHVVVDGPQHERFEDTLPRRRRTRAQRIPTSGPERKR